MSDNPTTGPGGPVSNAAATEPARTNAGTGFEANVAGTLSYVLGALTGILFLVIDGQRPFVRFHAAQAIVFTVAMVVMWILVGVLSMLLAVVPIIGWLVGILLSLALSAAGLVGWLYLMYRAWQGDEWEAPLIGKWARQFAARA
jgi:uncharacterized membrane protein